MIRRTKRSTPDRFAGLKVTIFFLGAGVWLAGVLADDMRITGVALVILAVGFLVRILTRARDEPSARVQELDEDVAEGGDGSEF
jgi:succinate dehydrogenase hydrophobic anchor subunit